MTVEAVLAIIGALVPLASAIASALNHDVRQKQAEGVEVAAGVLKASAVVNAVALNIDKVRQVAALLKAKK